MEKYTHLTRDEIDRSWDGFSSSDFPISPVDRGVLVECVRVDISKPRNRVSLIFTLVEVDSPNREVLCWFNAEPIKGKNAKNGCKVLPDSKFSKLYRITKGKNVPRYNRGRQAANHLLGEQFYIDIVSKPERGLEATKIAPKVIKESHLWGKTGRLYQKKRHAIKKENTGQYVGKEGVKGGQLVGKERVSVNALEDTGKGVEQIASTYNLQPVTKVPNTRSINSYLITDNEVVATGVNTVNNQYDDIESLLLYYDEAIDNSGFLN
ncbi:MAG: hypothetical protein ACPHHR_09765 [Cycloclasticus sp.]